MHQFKILLVGDEQCGKTQLSRVLAGDLFDQQYISTIGIDFQIIRQQNKNKHVQLQVWDTAGQERFQTITVSYYRNTHVAVLCFDLSKPITLESISKYIKKVKRYTPECRIILVGTKLDESIMQLEFYHCLQGLQLPCVITSAKHSFNIKQLINTLIDMCFSDHQLSLIQVTQPIYNPSPAKFSINTFKVKIISGVIQLLLIQHNFQQNLKKSKILEVVEQNYDFILANTVECYHHLESEGQIIIYFDIEELVNDFDGTLLKHFKK